MKLPGHAHIKEIVLGPRVRARCDDCEPGCLHWIDRDRGIKGGAA